MGASFPKQTFSSTYYCVQTSSLLLHLLIYSLLTFFSSFLFCVVTFFFFFFFACLETLLHFIPASILHAFLHAPHTAGEISFTCFLHLFTSYTHTLFTHCTLYTTSRHILHVPHPTLHTHTRSLCPRSPPHTPRTEEVEVWSHTVGVFDLMFAMPHMALTLHSHRTCDLPLLLSLRVSGCDHQVVYTRTATVSSASFISHVCLVTDYFIISSRLLNYALWIKHRISARLPYISV